MWPSYNRYLQLYRAEAVLITDREIEKNMKVDDIIALESLNKNNSTHKILKIVTKYGKTSHPPLEATWPDMDIDTIYNFNYVILPISRREVRFVHKNDIVLTYPEKPFPELEIVVKDKSIRINTDYNISSTFLRDNDLYRIGKMFHHKEL